MKIITAFFLAVSFFAAAQSPQVPHKMHFAEMTLVIRDDARRQIQKDVDALTQSPKHFNIKADRARSYFPIIEKIFAEEGVPDDFKYLVLQESSLVADAVSVSNAVGFWQFKDFTAMEMGLRVDHLVDERMNIASATRAAARYIKKNNSVFDNWVYALQAYQMGAGGVMRSEKDTHPGKKEMEITSATYWYVKKFLAYKVAYEQAVRGPASVDLLTFQSSSEEDLAKLAKQFSVNEDMLHSYNKWIRSSRIPGDKSYTVLIPTLTGVAVTSENVFQSLGDAKVSVKANKPIAYQPTVQVINGVRAVFALPGETPKKLAERVDVDLASFIKWNEISYESKLESGIPYFLGKKKRKAREEQYVQKKGESLWAVSQRFGVRLSRIKKFNRIDSDNAFPSGTVIWLARTRPKTESIAIAENNEVANDTVFNWDSESIAKGDSIESNPKSVPEASPVASAESPGAKEQQEQPKTVTEANPAAPSLQTAPVAIEADTLVIVPKNGEHIVQPKETLYGIAHLYRVAVMDLVRWNSLDLQQGIKIGQILKIKSAEEPAAAVASAKTPEPDVVLHEVQPSDTLYSIARKYGVTIKELMSLNEKKDFTLSVGEKLRVK